VSSPADSTNQGQPFVVVATYLPLRRYRDVISFVRLSGRVEAQLRASRGAIRYALKTDIPRKRFWTLSVWSSDESMSSFSRSEPHRTAMKKFYDWGTEKAAIVEWTSNDGKIDWGEAEEKLQRPMFQFRLEGKKLAHAAGSRSVAEN
jgi:quinol monooxygenase YgiN